MRACKFLSPIFSAISFTTFIFLPILSTNKNSTLGNKIAKGNPGKPPPVPTSIIFVPSAKSITLKAPPKSVILFSQI